MYYNILVARPFDQVFTYESDDQTLEVGQIVIVPFGKAMEVGMIMQADVSKPDYTIKKIETVINGIQLKEINIGGIGEKRTPAKLCKNVNKSCTG